MAWRIHDSVIRGEIDNRIKGTVRGRLWLHGFAEPLVLELTGNAWPDLAGCRLELENPKDTIPVHGAEKMQMLQRGTIGNLSASLKVPVFDVPEDQELDLFDESDEPEQIANAFYLEWFGDENGRVVIESADYKLTVSVPEWRLTPEEEKQRSDEAEAGMQNFLKKLNQAIEAQHHEGPEELEDWDEFDHEKGLRESDARTDKYMELLDEYGDTPEAEERIAKEMGWDSDTSPEAQAHIDELNAACEDALENPPQPDPLTEGKDWIRDEDGDVSHPLCARARKSVVALMLKLRELGLNESEDEDLITFESEFQITGAKLAGALNGLAYGHGLGGGFVVACLKRALGHLHKSQAGLEKLAPKKLLPDDLITHSRQELFAIREEILRLMNEFRSDFSG